MEKSIYYFEQTSGRNMDVKDCHWGVKGSEEYGREGLYCL